METLNDLEFDLVIVGAGPAGSSAAYAAAKKGIRVALIEKEESIAHTVRTSGVTWTDSAKEFGIPKDCYNVIERYGFYSPNNMVMISDNGNDTNSKAAVLDVRKTYRFLAQRAKNHGANIFLKTNVTDILKDERGEICGVTAIKHSLSSLSSQNPKKINFHAKIVIDASGFSSTVARALGVVERWKRFGVGAEWEAKVEFLKSDTWWLMVGQQYSPAGYAWIFPVNKDIVRIGVGIGKPESNMDPTTLLNKLLENKMGPIKHLGRIEPLEFHYGLIPNQGLIRKTVYNNLILVGDSAGQANPLVLEGIRYAIKFGQVAGTVSADAIRTGDTSHSGLLPYEKYWKKEIQSKINSAGKVQNRWMTLTDEQWDHELDIIKELSITEFLDFIKADFGLANIARLATSHPKLAVRQLFFLVKQMKK